MHNKLIMSIGALLAAAALVFCIYAIVSGSDPSISEQTINEVTSIIDETAQIPETQADITDLASPVAGVTESTAAITTSTQIDVAVTAAATSSNNRTTVPSASGKPASTAPAAPSATAATGAETTASAGVKTASYEYSYAGFNPQLADLDIDDWRLTLVNRDNILPDDYVPKLAPAVESDPDSKKLDYRVAPYYNEMYLAAKKDGITLTTVSGYRSYSLQKNNFENKISTYMNQGMGRTQATQKAAEIILPPGTSEHNFGVAMDICSLEQSFENTKEFKWLCENAENYGFILRYTKEKQSITKIIYEPWHWRFVGVENAKKINASGLCLEEYLGKA